MYDLLLTVAPTDAARLARVVAISQADGPESGLAALGGLPPTPPWPAVHGELLARLEIAMKKRRKPSVAVSTRTEPTETVRVGPTPTGL